MKFIPVSAYEQIIKLKKLKATEGAFGRKKCSVCKRVFNKGDFFIGNSRRRWFVCRTCSVSLLKSGIAETEQLKVMFQERIDDLVSNKDAYDNEEILNDL